MLSPQSAVTLSVRISPEERLQLEQLSHATGRTKSFLAAQAIHDYIQSQAWQIQAIEEAVQAADAPDATFIAHENISQWLHSWGTPDEQDAPR